MKKRRAAWILFVHLVVSSAGFGMLRVYQQGYNTMHREPVAMASISIQGERAEIQVLHSHCVFMLPSEDNPLYYAAYVLIDPCLKSWLYLLSAGEMMT